MRRQLAWSILILWFGFCTYFVFAGEITEPIPVLLFLAVFGAGAFTIWRWPQRGSVMLFLISIILTATILFGADQETRLFLLVTLALPPCLAAKLLQHEPTR